MSFGRGISWWGTRHRQGFWPRINCSQMKLPDFESPSSDNLSKSASFGLSKWIFYVKNHPNLSKKNFIEEYQFRRIFFVKSSGLPEFRSFGQKGKFSPFGFRFRPPKVKAEYGRNSRKALDFLLFVHENMANVNYQW